MPELITGKDVLGWCFTAVSLNFGVFGLVYGIYANAALMQLDYIRIISLLKWFCRVIAAVLITLTGLAATTALEIKARPSVFLIIFCFGVLALLACILAYRTWTPKPPAS